MTLESAIRSIIQEDLDLDEGRMKELHGYIEKGMSAADIAKKMKLDVKTIKSLMDEVDLDEGKQKPYVSSDKDGAHVMNASGEIVKSFKDMDSANAYLKKNYNKLNKEEVDSEDDEKETEKKAKKDEAETTGKEKVEINPTVAESAASDARRDMKKDKDLGRRKDSADNDDEAGAQDRTKLDTRNVIMQLKKAADNKNHKVKFDDGKSIAIKPEIVKAALAKFSKLKPNVKEKVQAQMQKSYKDMIKALTSIKEEIDLDEAFSNILDEGKMKDLLIKAQELMGPSKNRKEGIQMVAKGLKVSEKEATKLVDAVLKMNEDGSEDFAEQSSNQKENYTMERMGVSKDLVNSVRDVLMGKRPVEEKSGDAAAYKKFFDAALKKFKVGSPAELEGEQKKKFYDYIDKNWESDAEKAGKDEEAKIK